MKKVANGTKRPDPARDLSDALVAQQAAGPASTEALARSFLARMQQDIDEQVDLRVTQQLATQKAHRGKASFNDVKEVLLGSLGIGIPLTAIGGVAGHLPGFIVVWVGLIVINVVWAVAWLLRH